MNVRLPFPIEYDLMLEYTPTPFAGLWAAGTRLTTPIASNEEFKHSLFINGSGDLALLLQPGMVSVPWVNGKINVFGNSVYEPRFFVVVKKWSYCKQVYKYTNSQLNSVYVGMDDVTFYADGAVVKDFNVSIGGLDLSPMPNLVALDSSNTNLLPIFFPLVGKKLSITFTDAASEQVQVRLAINSGVDLNGRPINLSEPLMNNFVTIRKRPISEAPALGIQNGDLILPRVNGLPATEMPFSFTPIITGGVGPFEITITNPIGAIVSYSADTNLVSGVLFVNSNPAPSFSININDVARPGLFSKVINATFPNENVMP